MRKATLVMTMVVFSFISHGRETLDELSSDLYVIRINTLSGDDPTYDLIDSPQGCWVGSITNNYYEVGEMVITLGSDTLLDTSVFGKDENMKIKVVGNTSAMYSNKKQYKIKLGKKYDLLFRKEGKHKNKEWRLSGAGGGSLYTVTGFLVNHEVGMDWTPGFAFANLFLNDDYKGIYLLTEPVATGEGRCQVDDSGFLIESDAFYWKDSVYFKTDHQINQVGYTFKYPDSEDVSDDYVTAVKNYMNKVEDAIYGEGGNLSDYIDYHSFASWCLGHDILGTLDAGGSNRFLFKYSFSENYWLSDSVSSPDPCDTTRLSMTAMWDFDSAFQTPGTMSRIHIDPSFYYGQLFRDSIFSSVYRSVYENVSDSLFENVMNSLRNITDSIGVSLQYSRNLDEQRWGNPLMTVNGEMENIDEWFADRKVFLDEAILGKVPLQHNNTGSVEVFFKNGILCVSEDYDKMMVYSIDGLMIAVNPQLLHFLEGVYLVVVDGRCYKAVCK